MEKISISALKADDVKTWLLYPYTVDPIEFKASFAKIGIRIRNKEDISRLLELRNRNFDIYGKVKNSQGRRIYFDILKIAKNVNLSRNELVKALQHKLIEFVK